MSYMKKIAIVTDSTCDLSEELIKKFDIYVIPLYVNFKFKSYKDGQDITTKELYSLVEQEKELPKTAATSPADFIALFTKLFVEYEEIFYTGISSQMSSTLQNALVASQMMEKENKVFLLDSKNLSTGIGLIVLKACKYRDQGLDGKAIIEKLTMLVPLVRSQFAIETMEYLYKGGRCNSLVNFIGRVFKIKPIILVRDGKMDVGKKPHGNMTKALDVLIDYIKTDIDNIDKDAIFITHSEAYDSCSYLQERLKELKIDIPLYVTNAGCVISSHCGKGTIGILYIKEHE